MNVTNANPAPMHFPFFISSSLSYANKLEEMFPVDWSHISIVVYETNMGFGVDPSSPAETKNPSHLFKAVRVRVAL
jgi:hypothetical protein